MTTNPTLILAKHSAPIVRRDVAPRRWRLSVEGRRRCGALVERLRPHGPGFVIASEEPKALETAEIVAEGLGVGEAVYPGLHEHDRTGAPFLSDEDFYRTAKRFFEKPDEPVWGNGTADRARDRFEVDVRGVLEERQERVHVLVAHGTVISLLVARHNPIDAYTLWRDLGLPSFCVLSVPAFELRGIVPDVES